MIAALNLFNRKIHCWDGFFFVHLAGQLAINLSLYFCRKNLRGTRRSYNVICQGSCQQYQAGNLHRLRKILQVQCFLQELTILYVNLVLSLKVQETKTTAIKMYHLLQLLRFHILKDYRHIHPGYFWTGV